VKSSENLK